MTATDATAGYTRCSACWEVYDVAPGDPFTCPDCGFDEDESIPTPRDTEETDR